MEQNLNDLAQEIASREGKAKSVNIAQIKEIVRITCDIFAEIGWFNTVRLALTMRKNGLKRFGK